MAIYTNNSDETFIFPSVGVIVAPGESFETNEVVTTDGVAITTDKKTKIVKPETPIEDVPADLAPSNPVDPVSADSADATVTQ
jgi:hypothetical protein